MSMLEELGDELARKSIEAETRFDDPTITDEISKSIGATSSTLQEAFLTCVRIRRAANRADELLTRIVAGREKGEVITSIETQLEDDPSALNVPSSH